MVFPFHGYRGVTLLMTCLASGDFVPSTVFPTRGYRGATPSVPYTGNAIRVLYWRRLILAMPPSSDALSWRRPILATPYLGDALFWRRLVRSIC